MWYFVKLLTLLVTHFVFGYWRFKDKSNARYFVKLWRSTLWVTHFQIFSTISTMSGDTLSLTFTMPKVKTLSISHCVKYKVKHWSNTNGQWFIFKYLPLKRFSGKGPMTLYDSFVKYLPPLRYCSKYLKNESQLRYCWQPLPWHLHYVRCPTLYHSQQASREPQKR